MAVNTEIDHALPRRLFLSCLRGSEQPYLKTAYFEIFLSCLRGSELPTLLLLGFLLFLSCLRGSEQTRSPH